MLQYDKYNWKTLQYAQKYKIDFTGAQRYRAKSGH